MWNNTLTRMLLTVDAVRLVFRRNDYYWIKYFLLPAFAAVNMYYSMEPNGFTHRYFWMVGLFISGMIRGWLDLKNVKKLLKV